MAWSVHRAYSRAPFKNMLDWLHTGLKAWNPGFQVFCGSIPALPRGLALGIAVYCALGGAMSLLSSRLRTLSDRSSNVGEPVHGAIPGIWSGLCASLPLLSKRRFSVDPVALAASRLFLDPTGLPSRLDKLYTHGVFVAVHPTHGLLPEHRTLSRWHESQADRSRGVAGMLLNAASFCAPYQNDPNIPSRVGGVHARLSWAQSGNVLRHACRVEFLSGTGICMSKDPR